MRAMTSKLRSKSGASLLFALLFLLFCVLVGGTVLAGASANSYRIARMNEKQQQELDERSAAQFVAEELGMGGEIPSLTFTHNSTEVMVTLGDDAPLTSLQRLMVEMAIRKHVKETGAKTVQVRFTDVKGNTVTSTEAFWYSYTGSGSSEFTAKVKLSATNIVDREISIGYFSGKDNYDLTADLGEDSMYTVRMKANYTQDTESDKIYYLNWKSVEISKGGS